MNKIRKLMSSTGLAALLLLLSCFALSGCISVRGSESINDAPMSKAEFSKKTIAVLPVKEQAALSTDSLLSLRVAINDQLDNKIRAILTGSKIIDTKTAVDILNDQNKLGLLDDFTKIYDSTGVFDKRMIASMCSVLKTDYIVFSRLKAEKMSVGFVGKGFGASLEVAIVSQATHDIVWAGSGEFKRGGIWGAGGTQNKKAAEELVKLVFQKF